jgi:hypothetical protein
MFKKFQLGPFTQISVLIVHVTNKFAYMDNLRGCHVKVLNKINSKFNKKLEKINANKLMLTIIT